ncbi:unnamed protein product [Blepharisma stoltei]|uniref:Uncharacterized protein n=1 Tax=Blepharisma stoltei TaxID=1481888 RepID=A0AAU9IZV5_9CILI|nr:unnamed protein product [Blepharisma stoltei]
MAQKNTAMIDKQFLYLWSLTLVNFQALILSQGRWDSEVGQPMPTGKLSSVKTGVMPWSKNLPFFRWSTRKPIFWIFVWITLYSSQIDRRNPKTAADSTLKLGGKEETLSSLAEARSQSNVISLGDPRWMRYN